MKIPFLRVFFLLRDIRHFVSDYIEFRKPYSEKGSRLSANEWKALYKKAFYTLENIVNLFVKEGVSHV